MNVKFIVDVLMLILGIICAGLGLYLIYYALRDKR